MVHVNPVKQTLIQLDLPPDLVLKQEIPLPAMTLWSDQPVARFKKEFVPPPVKPVPEMAQSLPAAPMFEAPNREPHVADLKIAATLLNDIPKLIRPAATTSPVRIPGPEWANQIPQVILPDLSETVAPALISLSDFVLRSGPVVVLPPANQIAPSSGSMASAGAQEAAQGAVASSSNAKQLGGTAAGTVGITLITHPKDGSFGAVVVGSESSGPYDEEHDPLRGRVVYTVYVDVGLRKKWILEYCLAKAAQQREGLNGSATPLDGPWPFLVARPDGLGISDTDYILIHGIINMQGRFEELALILPEKLEQKDLLMNSLKFWEFRPASRDGQPTPVEVLLVIPWDFH